MKNIFKVGMISLGCPKNQVDGEMMLEKLNKNGFRIVQNIEVAIKNSYPFNTVNSAKRF